MSIILTLVVFDIWNIIANIAVDEKKRTMKNYRIEALILALGIVILGFITKSAVDRFIERERVVSVKGLAERDVKADLVVWPLVYKEAGNDPAAMYEAITRKNAAIVDFLKSKGIAGSEISVSPPSVYDKQGDRYTSDNSPYRYNLRVHGRVHPSKLHGWNHRNILHSVRSYNGCGRGYLAPELTYPFPCPLCTDHDSSCRHQRR